MQLENVAASLQIAPIGIEAMDEMSVSPSGRDVFVSWALERPGGAVLELYDATGRRVRVRELPAGASRGTLNLGEGDLLPTGVYVVRLVQGTKQASAKAVVAR